MFDSQKNGTISVEEVVLGNLNSSAALPPNSPTILLPPPVSQHCDNSSLNPPLPQVAALLATFVLPSMDATLTPIAQVSRDLKSRRCALLLMTNAQGVCSRYGGGDSLTFEQFTRFITKEDLETKLTIQF